MEFREVEPHGFSLFMIQARQSAETGNWEFRCRRTWESDWAPLDSAEDLVSKAVCPIDEFDARYPGCILDRSA